MVHTWSDHWQRSSNRGQVHLIQVQHFTFSYSMDNWVTFSLILLWVKFEKGNKIAYLSWSSNGSTGISRSKIPRSSLTRRLKDNITWDDGGEKIVHIDVGRFEQRALNICWPSVRGRKSLAERPTRRESIYWTCHFLQGDPNIEMIRLNSRSGHNGPSIVLRFSRRHMCSCTSPCSSTEMEDIGVRSVSNINH